VTYSDGAIFRAGQRLRRGDYAESFPAKYTKDLAQSALFNANISSTVDEFARWQGRHSIDMEPDATRILDRYVQDGFALFSTLVEHPSVPDPQLYLACSIVLQRAAIIYSRGRETLYFRSQFHSAKDESNFVNFIPNGAVEVAFASDTIWFPLELTSVISEPASYLDLEILTERELATQQIPEPLQLQALGETRYAGAAFYVTRVSGSLSSKQRWADLRLRP
jgi:hypothetical protein